MMTIKEQIELLEQEKIVTQDFLDDIEKKYKKKKISLSNYDVLVHIRLGGKTKKEYYADMNNKILNLKNELKETKKHKLSHTIPVSVAVAALLLSLLAFTFLSFNPNITGFVIYGNEKQFTLDINKTFTSDDVLELDIENITSLKVSGYFAGENAKIYLDNNGNKILVFDSGNIKIKNENSGNLITGNFVLGAEDNATNITDESINQTNETNQTLNETINETLNETLNQTINKTPEQPPEINQTNETNQTPEYKYFNKVCEDSCSLENISKVKLIIEVSNAELHIDSITYTKPIENHKPVLLKNISDIYFNDTYELNLSEYFYDEDGDKLLYDLNEIPGLKAKVKDDIMTLTSKSNGSYDAYIYATDNKEIITSNTFRIYIGTQFLNNTVNETNQTNITAFDFSKLKFKLDEKLKTLLQQNGKIRVIVKLKQGTELQNLKKFNKKIKDYESVELSLDDLILLENNTDIIEIIEDQPVSLLLNESLPLIRVPEVYNLNPALNGTGIKVCVLDTGVDYNVVKNYAYGYDFVNNDSDPMDDNGHGTQVANVIYAIAPGSQLIAVKVINSSGIGYESDVLNGLQYCIDQNASIISFSIGSGSYNGFCDDNIVAGLANDAVASGISVIAATGNDNSENLKAPSCGSNVTRVSATDKQDNIASFSNVNNITDLFAPGVNINTISVSGTNVSVSGTSFSTPHVSGVSALILQNETLNPKDLKYRLRSTGKTILWNGINISRIDAFNALINNKTNEPFDYFNFTQQSNQSNQTGNYSILSWWNSSFSARKPIYIAVRSGTAEPNYTVQMNITYASVMQADFDDLRFTDDDNTTVLPYWVQETSNSAWAIVWVNIKDIITTTNQTIFMYYGNSTVSTVSNISSTFLFGDDFNDNSINTAKWMFTTGTWAEQGGILNLTAAGADPSKAYVNITNSTNFSVVGRVMPLAYGADKRLGMAAKIDNVGATIGRGYNVILRDNDTLRYDLLHDGVAWGNYYYSPGWNFTIGSWVWMEVSVMQAGANDNVSGRSWRNATVRPTTWPVSSLWSGRTNKTAGFNPGYNGRTALDDFFVRKFVNPEPDYVIGNTEGMGGCNNGTYIYTCGETVLESCSMIGNLNNCSGSGFVVGTNDITINCSGYWITGTNTASSYGIDLSSKTGTVRNCNIANFSRGVYITTNNTYVINTRTENNTDSGIYISGAISNVTIDSVNSTRNTNYGIYVTGAKNTIQRSMFFNNTQYGIYLTAASTASDFYNYFTLNQVYNNSGGGVYIVGGGGGPTQYYPFGNLFSYNNITSNTGNGLYLAYSTIALTYSYQNIFTNNRIFNNSGDNLLIDRSYDNIFENNYYNRSGYSATAVDINITRVSGDVYNNFFTNETYNKSAVVVNDKSAGAANATFRYYLWPYVNDTNGNGIVNATVQIYDRNSNLVKRGVTNTSGYFGDDYTLFNDSGAIVLFDFQHNSTTVQGLLDRSGNGNNGTVYGANYTTSGKFGGAYVFNNSWGSTIIDAGNSTNLMSAFQSHSFSVEAWVYYYDNPSYTDVPIMQIQGDDVDKWLQFMRRNGKMLFGFYADDLTSTGANITPNAWWHVVGTFDSSTNARKIYVNGRLDALDTASGVLNVQGNYNLTIGQYSGNYMHGIIDSFAVYNRTLTPQEIWDHYNARIALIDYTQNRTLNTTYSNYTINVSSTPRYNKNNVSYNTSVYGNYAPNISLVGCGGWLYSDYTLNGNITDCTSNGLDLYTNTIVLNCNGYYIMGRQSGYGVFLSGASAGSSVRNCFVQNFSTGIDLYSTSSATFINNTIYNNLYAGANFTASAATGSSNNLFQDNNVSRGTNSNAAYRDFFTGGSKTSTNNTLLNSTTNESANNFVIGTAGDFFYISRWITYYVNDSLANAISGATLNVYDKNNALRYTGTTDSAGFIGNQIIIVFNVTATGTATNLNNYTFNATKVLTSGISRNVTNGSNSIQNITIANSATACGTVTTNVSLINDINDNGVGGAGAERGCLYVTSNNVYINCSFYWINSTSSCGAVNCRHSIWITANNTQVLNCRIQNQQVSGMTYGTAIKTTGANTTIMYNSIFGTKNYQGIWFTTGNGQNVSYNNISNETIGIQFDAVNLSNLYWNNISNSSVGLNLSLGSSWNNITYCNISDNTNMGVVWDNSVSNYIKNCRIVNNTYDGIFFLNPFTCANNTIVDSILSGNYASGIYNDTASLTGTSGQNINYLINSTFNKSSLNVHRSALYVQWYEISKAVNKSSTYISNANISVYDSSNSFKDSQLTNGTGYTNVRNFTEYSAIGGVYTYYTLLIFNATKTGYANNSMLTITFNLSGSTTGIPVVNVTMDALPTHTTPTITPTSPNISFNISCVNQSTSDPESDPLTNIYGWYLNNISYENLIMPFDTNISELTSSAILDYTVYGNNGTLGGGASANAPTWINGTRCKLGGCYIFSSAGSQYISLPDSVSLNISTNITIEAWINASSASNGTIVSKRLSAGSAGFIFGLNSTGNLTAQFWNSTGISVIYSHSTRVNDSKWHYVAWTYDSSKTSNNFILYVDGVAQTFSTSGTINLSKTTAAQIGEDTRTGSLFFNGTIDELRIYNRTLSAAEISAHNLTLYNTTVYQELQYNQTWNCSVTPNDQAGDGSTLISNLVTVNNAAPYVVYQNSFTNLSTGHNFTVTAGVYDVDGSSDIKFTNISNTSGNCSYDKNTTSGNYFNVTYNCTGTIGATNTVTLGFRDSVNNFIATTASGNKYPNQAPTATLTSPTSSNTTIRTRTPTFNWTTSDADMDPVNVNISINTTNTCTNPIYVNTITDLNYTTSQKLCVRTEGTGSNTVYNWTVQPCDAGVCGNWATTQNFSIQPWISISLTTSSIAFGTLNITSGQNTKNTTTGNPAPFRVQNDGDVVVDLINITTNASMWVSSTLCTTNKNCTMFKANYSNETNSFNYSGSLTNWTNLTWTSNQSVINQLNYTGYNNSASIDVWVEVPPDEPSGTRTAYFIFSWIQDPSG